MDIVPEMSAFRQDGGPPEAEMDLIPETGAFRLDEGGVESSEPQVKSEEVISGGEGSFYRSHGTISRWTAPYAFRGRGGWLVWRCA